MTRTRRVGVPLAAGLLLATPLVNGVEAASAQIQPASATERAAPETTSEVSTAPREDDDVMAPKGSKAKAEGKGKGTGTGKKATPTGWIVEGGSATMEQVRSVVGAETLQARGYDGQGIGVALLDTGVVGVPGLDGGNVVDGPDLSFESQSESLAHLDTFGHGTHLAGVIAGQDASGSGFRGIAPGARLTSLKLASAEGAVDVSQVVAAVDWVVAHRADDPAHPIRVVNLSYGTDGVQDARLDPLTHAVENAWRAGIVVVVSGGNDGDSGQLDNPAYDPYVLAVGASDTQGTPTRKDDTVPDFSARGDSTRRVDLVAPGRSIVSLRNPGSYLDEEHPGARVDERFFKGSGTSQAAAVVSGAVALLLQQRPDLTPDEVKAVLTSSASTLPAADAAGQGQGELDVVAAASTKPKKATQSYPRSTGLGSLEAARGTSHVVDDGVELTGEQTVLGPWSAADWVRESSAGRSWAGGSWLGQVWTGDCACGTGWSSSTWSSAPWEGRSWAGRSWEGRSWAGRSWAGRSWAGSSWAGRSWAGRSWAGRSWATADRTTVDD